MANDILDNKITEIKELSNRLDEANALYDDCLDEWLLFIAVYEGIKEIKRLALIEQHERESDTNYNRRLKELFGFAYSKSIINLFVFYLFKKEPRLVLPKSLQNNQKWEWFQQDCDLYGNAYSTYILKQQRFASIYGHIGLLVDKPTGETKTQANELSGRIYPYIAAYHPQAIHDWRYEKDRYNRPQLSYLKLQEDDGKYRVWYPDRWELWQEEDGDNENRLIDQGGNPLGEIPFVWLRNFEHRRFPLGVSDIQDVAYIDLSIIRNLSQAEEIISYAAFPMLRKPMQEEGAQVNDDVGPTAILEYDPEHPETKPDWLPAEVNGPLEAIRDYIVMKVQEIYRASNAGGMAAMEIATQAKSGTALKTEFQLLNSMLVAKAINLEKAEKNIFRLWLKWEKLERLNDEIQYERARSYDVQNLKEDLENVITAKTAVLSQKFSQEIQKGVARQMLPGADEDTLQQIDREIEQEPELPPDSVFEEEEEEEIKQPEEKEEEEKQVNNAE